MPRIHIRTFDVCVFLLSITALVAAILLAILYVNDDNPDKVLFLLRKDTYDKVLPFLLSTVAVGGLALGYSRVQRLRERELEQRRIAKATLDRRIQRLQNIYETVLAFFHDVRLQRRRLRIEYVPAQKEGTWKIRRGLFEEVCRVLNEAQLAGVRIVKTLDFDQDALKGELPPIDSDSIRKLHSNIKSQIGGIEGILRNVLKSAEWKGITDATTSDEDFVMVPEGFIKFADSGATGNLSFGKISQHFDAFSKNILQRIQELEKEASKFIN